MGFYDDFIGSINDVVFGSMRRKIRGMQYLIRLGIGWIIGMGLAVLVLNMLFEQNIHWVSSMFVGFIIGALPMIIVFMLGLVAGAASVVRLIQIGLERFCPQMVYFILGMMAASLYAIVLGPTTLEVPQEPLGLKNFNVYEGALGIALVVGMQVYRNHMEQ